MSRIRVESLLVAGAVNSQLDQSQKEKERLEFILNKDPNAKISYAIFMSGFGTVEKVLIAYDAERLEEKNGESLRADELPSAVTSVKPLSKVVRRNS